MIVRPHDDTAEIVTQVDHAEVAGALAEAWTDAGPLALAPRGPMVIAARLHDIGWRHWEVSPRLNPDTGRPANFLDVVIEEHLRLYRLGIEEVEAHDPYAGMLVSMHAAGIYTGRYDTQPALRLSRAPDVQTLVDDFVAVREAHYGALRERLGVPPEELWRNYVLLQVFDRLSLRLCQGDPAGPGPMEIVLPDGGTLHVRTDGDVERIDPWPFAVDTVEVVVPTRVIPLEGYAGDAALMEAFAGAVVEGRVRRLVA